MSAFARLPSILIVEDNQKDLELLQWRFRDAHLMNPVRIVRNGLEATLYLAGAEDPHMERARSCGADAFLIKGLDTDGLIELLKNASLGWALVPTHGAEMQSDSRRLV